MQIMAQNQIQLNVESLGLQNKEIIVLLTGSITYSLLFVNLKQMSFVARLVMAVSIFVIIWVIFEASMKIYILSHMVKMVQEKVVVAPAPPVMNATLDLLRNTS